MKKILFLAILLVMIISGCSSKIELDPGEGADTYYQLDLNSLDKEENLGNLRIICKDHYEFKPTKEKYHLDDSYIVDEKGLAELNISGSKQFSKDQFYELVADLRKVANDKKIYIIDLRQENHGFINGYPVSFYKEHNWANKGLTEEEIENNQKKYFSHLLNKEITTYLIGDDEKASKDNIKLKVNEYLSEKELVQSVGFEYLNIPCSDHIWPSPDNIDKFIEFVKSINKDESWIHFHCAFGEGRTGVFMCLYDMMKNPDVSLRSIAYRQTKLGSSFPLYIQNKEDWKKSLYQERADNFVLLYKYVQENHKDNYQLSWSEWLNNYSNQIDVLRVSLLPMLSNGEHARSILEDMWNKIEPNIKLEFVETKYSDTSYPTLIDVQVRSMENLPFRIKDNHFHQLYTDEINNYDDLLVFAKTNMAIDNKIYGIPQLLCDNFFFYYKNDKEMDNVESIYDLNDILDNDEKVYYDPNSYNYYAIDSAIDEKGAYDRFSSENCLNDLHVIYQNMKQITANGIYSTDSKNSYEFANSNRRAIICYSEDLYNTGIDFNELKVKKISFAQEKDIPLIYMDEVCISEHVKDEVKYAKCLKLANLLTSNEYLEQLIFIDNEPQYFIPVLESVFDICNKYPLYPKIYRIVNDHDLRLALANDENLNDILKTIKEYKKLLDK